MRSYKTIVVITLSKALWGKGVLRQVLKEAWLKEITEIFAEIEQLEERLSNENAVYKELEKKRESLNYELKSSRNSLNRIQKLRKELDKTETAFQKLWKLSTLANGQSGEGGKYSFSRYVLGTFFEEIIEQCFSPLGLSKRRYQYFLVLKGNKQNVAEKGG